MPAAIAIPLIIGAASTGAQVAGTVVAHKAASKAAKVQKAAEDQALALQKQQYQDAQQRYVPYQQVGQSALPTLQSLAQNHPALPYGTNLAGLSVYGSQPPMSQPGGNGGPSSMLQGSGSMGGGQAQGGGMVTLQAPDGSTQSVRPELVSHYVQKGAKVLR